MHPIHAHEQYGPEPLILVVIVVVFSTGLLAYLPAPDDAIYDQYVVYNIALLHTRIAMHVRARARAHTHTHKQY